MPTRRGSVLYGADLCAHFLANVLCEAQAQRHCALLWNGPGDFRMCDKPITSDSQANRGVAP